jgi:hypothetical protein
MRRELAVKGGGGGGRLCRGLPPVTRIYAARGLCRRWRELPWRGCLGWKLCGAVCRVTVVLVVIESELVDAFLGRMLARPAAHA